LLQTPSEFDLETDDPRGLSGFTTGQD
jgi:hypothetical protein